MYAHMSYIYLPSIYHIGKKPERILCWVGSYLWFYKIHPHPMGQRWRVSNSSKQTYLGNYMHNELTQPFRVVVPCYLLLRMYVGTWACPPCLLGHKEWRIYDSRNLRETPISCVLLDLACLHRSSPTLLQFAHPLGQVSLESHGELLVYL